MWKEVCAVYLYNGRLVFFIDVNVKHYVTGVDNLNNFIVMQGHTYQEEKTLGIIWSPQQDNGGKVPHSWSRMRDVKEGDKVFHYVKGKILAISTVYEGCTMASKPSPMQNRKQWKDEGYLVRLKYYELTNPVNIRDNFNEILPLLPIKYSPFQHNSDGNQGYLYPCNEELAIKILELIGEMNIYQVSEEQLELSIDAVRRTENTTLIPVISETESEMKTKIRLGQQKFRRELMPLWEHKCALCDINLSELLRASHSKPWKDGTNIERIDPYNGILLCCNHDALYDKGLITIDIKGKLHVSTKIKTEDYLLYGLDKNIQVKTYSQNKVYFNWHRKNIFK